MSSMGRFGLLGYSLSHSYSPQIHARLGKYSYELFDVREDELPRFLKEDSWDGCNVTVPYKKSVLPYCRSLSETAKAIGAVNTLIRGNNGSLYGDNTDAYGFQSLLAHENIDVSNRTILVLGSGGASAAVCYVIRKNHGTPIVISRTGENNYQNLHRFARADGIINTTPVGMYPHNGVQPLDLTEFPCCSFVVDVIYNPWKTALLLQAEELGIQAVNGIWMLVAQAEASAALFQDRPVDESVIAPVVQALQSQTRNIALIGMPGCGKSALAQIAAERWNRPLFDCDLILQECSGLSASELIQRFGENAFRQFESNVLKEICKKSGVIIATGGGCVTYPENDALLRQNSCIVWLTRELDKLEQLDRPISKRKGLDVLFQERKERYQSLADVVIDNNGTLEETWKIWEECFK